MKIPILKIGDLVARLPIIQGGMGVGVSLANLAAAVANCGGVGVISGVETGFYRADYHLNKRQANRDGLREQIKKARGLSTGILGVNIMVAINDFEEMVRTAVRAGIDIIFSGAGLPLNLPALVKGSNVKIGPIISSARAAGLICKHWDKKHRRPPDVVVVEGPRAGGHLGFSPEQLEHPEDYALEKLVPAVVAAVRPFEEKYERPIPVIAAGGIWDGFDIARLLRLGAAGVQLATRFVTTRECDASDAFKAEYLRAGQDDIVIIKSPVGMPGRAIRNAYLDRAAAGKSTPVRCAYNCLAPCVPSRSPYCIADALIHAQKGELDKGFAFAGANAWRASKISSVKEIMTELVEQMKKA
ncbi:nitronate monooxygenase family protein [Gelria sp. Kuro-4]|uniref:NAD(P)H-dependent flavin oxidoreductase n=1 Tax=Gelria sp. Kuro-4 TaxID=2796927 RepID=UPI001BEF978B|nr:nitronate monooxygenase family protein [Gelria sp. Kuro-4]BCV25577.1 2-nitropropane dioxygenase [Gelria sp. Kuro-4]